MSIPKNAHKNPTTQMTKL